METESEEKASILEEASIIIKAHNLGQYEFEERAIIKKRAKEIMDKAQLFDINRFDITTQAFLARYFHNLLRDKQVIDQNELKWCIAIGFVLAEEVIKNQPK